MLNKFYQLVAALYAGGYRILAVFLVGALATPEASANYAKFFFWAGLICSVTGVPIAARAQVKDNPLSHYQQAILFLAFSALFGAVAFFFWNGSLLHFGITLIAGALLSVFEINRMERAAEGKFALLTLCSIISLALLFLAIFYSAELGNWLIVPVFAGLASPVLLSYFIIPHKVTASITLTQATKPVSANAFSSLIVTGMTFIVPILLIEEFGDQYSTLLAQIYSVAALAFAYPRYVATGFIVAAKQGKATINDVKSLTRNITLFAIFSCVVFCAVTWLLAPQMLQFTLLFVAMQLSQVTVPYANWWTSHGKEFSVMLLNFASLLVLSVAVAGAYMVLPQGEWRGQVILICFVAYQLLRFILYSRFEHYRSN